MKHQHLELTESSDRRGAVRLVRGKTSASRCSGEVKPQFGGTSTRSRRQSRHGGTRAVRSRNSAPLQAETGRQFIDAAALGVARGFRQSGKRRKRRSRYEQQE